MITNKIQTAPAARRDTGLSLRRGWCAKCPNCGKGSMFSSFLKVADRCGTCGEELHHHRADDAPPYFTILVVGHVIVAGILYVEQTWQPEPWVHSAIWMPLTIVLSLLLLPRFKGALIGLQWAQRMHGFGGPDPNDPAPAPER